MILSEFLNDFLFVGRVFDNLGQDLKDKAKELLEQILLVWRKSVFRFLLEAAK